MSGWRTLAFPCAFALACTPSPAPEPERVPASVVIPEPVAPPPAPVVIARPEPAPMPAPDPACPHRTLRAACKQFDGVDYDDEELEDDEDGIKDCEELRSGIMPDGATRYHVVTRWWNDVSLAELLVLEVQGCFTLIGDLGWSTLHTERVSTKFAAIDLDDDGEKDEAVFRIVERVTDAESENLTVTKHRSARYCRKAESRWTCTEVLSEPLRAEDWPE